jgi:4-hydroxyphenylpyruvate dioxygenase
VEKMLPETLPAEPDKKTVEELPVSGYDHIEFWVGNALQCAYFFHHGFGFDIVAYRGLETGNRDVVSYVLKQDHVCLVITGSLSPNSEIARHVMKHGDGVHAVAYRTTDAKAAYDTAVARGAHGLGFTDIKDADGVYKSGSVLAYGETVHSFVERESYYGAFGPGYKKRDQIDSNKVGLAAIDHVVGNVEEDKMDAWMHFYTDIFGFRIYQQFDPEDISTKYSALASVVTANKSGNIKMNVNEPAEGVRKSQIQEYLDYYIGPGVQHIAIATRDIVHTVARLKERGIKFLTIPRSYYDALPARVGQIDEDIEELARLGILVDRESDGYLLQIFTNPVQDRPTLFFEVIQRKGAKGFGQGNFQALFESIEREQALRGNL